MAPETSMGVQAALNSDLALVFDECTPFHVDRDYTARSTERTHRWLERCLRWHSDHGPPEQLVYGIVQGGVHEDLRVESAETIAAAGTDGIAIGGSLGAEKEQIYEVVRLDDRRARRRSRDTAAPPARHRRDRRPAELRRARHRHVRLRDAHAPGPPRHGAGARPRQPLARRPHRGPLPRLRGADHGGLPVPGVRRRPPARVPALSAQVTRADGLAAADAAQPRIHRAPHGAAARARSPPAAWPRRPRRSGAAARSSCRCRRGRRHRRRRAAAWSAPAARPRTRPGCRRCPCG